MAGRSEEGSDNFQSRVEKKKKEKGTHNNNNSNNNSLFQQGVGRKFRHSSEMLPVCVVWARE